MQPDTLTPQGAEAGRVELAGGAIERKRAEQRASLDQWWCPSPCATANRSFRLRCRTCGTPEPADAVRSALYAIPQQYL